MDPIWHENGRSILRWLVRILQPERDVRGLRHRMLVRAYLELLAASERMRLERLKRMQSIGLQSALRVAANVPWWRERFGAAGIGTAPAALELKRLPPVSREELARVPRANLLAPGVSEAKMNFRATSGTTGVPFAWGYERSTHLSETASYFYRVLSWYGVAARRRTGRPFIASFVYGSYAVPAVEFSWNPAGPDANDAFRRMIDHMRAEDLQILFIYPTDLVLLVQRLQRLGMELPLHLVVTTGQALEEEYREYAQERLGCRVVSVYNTREFGPTAIECPEQPGRFHISAERVLIEITDEAGRTLPDGEAGFVTATSLENRAMPLLRYRSGDRGRIVPELCPCGRTLPLLEFSGRSSDFIMLPSGQRVPFRHISSLILRKFFNEIERYQAIQTSEHSLRIRMCLRPGISKAFERIFISHLRSLTNNELDISVERSEKWPEVLGKKAKLFIPLSLQSAVK